jgi:hypothetical protein
VLFAVAVAMAAIGVGGATAPAYADDGGNTFCFLSSGSVTAPSPVQYGQLITVQWSVSAPYCDAFATFVNGPGFGGSGDGLPADGSRTVRALTDGATATWTLYMVDLNTGNGSVYQLASRTITVQ